MDDDIRRCGGPIGSKRRQKRLSSVNFMVFGRFSARTQPIAAAFDVECRPAIIFFLRH